MHAASPLIDAVEYVLHVNGTLAGEIKVYNGNIDSKMKLFSLVIVFNYVILSWYMIMYTRYTSEGCSSVLSTGVVIEWTLPLV